VNNLTVLFFILSTAALGGAAFALMWKSLRSIDEMPMKNYRQGTWTTEVTKPIHPEMRDVKPGTELLGVNFEKKTECDIEEYKALQERIEEIKAKLEGEDEDDDGDIVVRT
tara:strand:- start:524 stop:856 length:333 start_codon:yes stop_codon:yes gene_type:complete